MDLLGEDMPNVDASAANDLLKKKYEHDVIAPTLAQPSLTQMKAPFQIKSSEKSEVDWRFIAQERLQMMEQLRNEMNEWCEAFQKERERSEKFENLFLESILNPEVKVEVGKQTEENNEVKHTISTPAQVNRKRANWPEVKRRAEEMFHDAGIQKDEVVEVK